MTTTNHGFQYVPELIELDKAFANHPPVEADVFISASQMVEGIVLPDKIDVVNGEIFIPDFMNVSRNGSIMFWFRAASEPTSSRRFGFRSADVNDVFPALQLPMPPERLAELNQENERVIGQRLRVIETINKAIHKRREDVVQAEIDRQEAERKKTYAEDDDAGMF